MKGVCAMSRHHSGGYTIAELLVIIAILATLSAIVIASLTAYHASLTVKRLNSAAEELFLYAQNRLIYVQIYGSSESSNICESAAGHYILVGDGLENGLVSYGILSAVGGRSAYIELDINSGDILAVFYSETLNAEELEEKVASLESRSAEILAAHRIGYYDGKDRSISPREYAFVPDVRVVNENELYIEITCGDIPDVSASEFSVYLTLSSDVFTAEEFITDLTVNDGVLTARLLIDAITPNGGSYYIENHSPFFGKSGLKAKAIIYCRGFGITSERTAERRSVYFDPLYESKNGNEVKIYCLRHLNNLRYLSDSSEITVLQTRDISFDTDVNAARFLPLPNFKGIYDGRDNLIYDIQIDEDASELIGLFSEISGEMRNVHIVGTDGYSLTVRSDITAAGALCGRLNSGGIISNCSVSDMSFEYITESDGDVFVGGIAGASLGSITRCSSCADISLNALNSAFAGVGGLVGWVESGDVEHSHSAGKLTVDRSYGALTVAGIAVGKGGSIVNCYSECSAGYISGAAYYGIGDPDAKSSGCFFVYESAWLADAFDGGIAYSDLADITIEGFSKAERTVASVSQNCPLPESVTQFGIPTRFGNTALAEPRGLIGLIRVEYSGGAYHAEPLADFDAYGNDSAVFPNIEWNDPAENEVRYYFFVSSFASPEEGDETGWNYSFSNESAYLGEAEEVGTFVCRRVFDVLNGDTVTLRFGSQFRTSEISMPSETVSDGMLGVIAIVYHAQTISLDPVTWFPVEVPEHYEYCYGYVDPSNRTVKIVLSYELDPSMQIPELETLRFEANYDKEVRIYVFSDEGLALHVGSLWNFSSSFSNAAPEDIGTFSGYRYFEIYRGRDFSTEHTVSFVYGGAEIVEFNLYCSLGLDGPAINISDVKR